MFGKRLFRAAAQQVFKRKGRISLVMAMAMAVMPVAARANSTTSNASPNYTVMANISYGGQTYAAPAAKNVSQPVIKHTTFHKPRLKSDPALRAAQQRLAALGYYPANDIDGVMGTKTRHATINFQRDHGLKADGILGPKTLAVLEPAPAITHAQRVIARPMTHPLVMSQIVSSPSQPHAAMSTVSQKSSGKGWFGIMSDNMTVTPHIDIGAAVTLPLEGSSAGTGFDAGAGLDFNNMAKTSIGNFGLSIGADFDDIRDIQTSTLHSYSVTEHGHTVRGQINLNTETSFWLASAYAGPKYQTPGGAFSLTVAPSLTMGRMDVRVPMYNQQMKTPLHMGLGAHVALSFSPLKAFNITPPRSLRGIDLSIYAAGDLGRVIEPTRVAQPVGGGIVGVKMDYSF